MEISVDELEKVRNDYAQLGKQLERERIIALLEAKSDWYYEKAIALIKGENE